MVNICHLYIVYTLPYVDCLNLCEWHHGEVNPNAAVEDNEDEDDEHHPRQLDCDGLNNLQRWRLKGTTPA